jgi:acetolactate synthase I/II/III large subunit
VKYRGAELILQCLKEQGVDTIFGYPGGAVIPLYDALYDEKEITHIITAHEQGAAHAADGYARATGKAGVVVATSGPGATNTVTGIATAFGDSVPMVVITGQVASSLLGRDSFQEVNITDITRSITKKNYLVSSIESLPGIIEEAFRIAQEGRPGPVLIDIPKDIQLTFIEYSPKSCKNSYFEAERSTACDKESDTKAIEQAIEAINNSKRPVIYAGGGVGISGAQQELVELSEKIKSPVACSLMGLGNIPADHQNFMGMVGMHGTHCSNYAVTHCDLLIAVGARFSDRVASHPESFASKAKIIHIDIDPKELGKNVTVHIPICGDLKAVLRLINEKVNAKKDDEWSTQINEWKKRYPLKYDKAGVSPQRILTKLHELTKGDVVITTEVGQNQMWTAQYFNFLYPRTFITSGGLGTMGFGLGAAIGASVGKCGAKVVNVAGDGSFKMNSTEMATVKKYRLPIVQLVFNNHALGMVKQWQEMFCKGRLSFTLLEPDVDFVKLAEAYGIKAMRISSNEEIEAVLAEALSMKEPVLVECDINPDYKVLPMVAPGAPIHEIIHEV